MKCKICEKELKDSLKSLAQHILNNHKEIGIKNYYDEYFKKEKENVCLECGKETKFEGLKKGYRQFCSTKCSNSNKNKLEKTREINLNKYGGTGFQVKELSDKSRKTTKDKYGVEFGSQSKEVQKKQIETFRKTLGVDWPPQNRGVREKQVKTLQHKYNTDNPMKVEKIKNKQHESMLKKYGVETYSQTQEWRNKMLNGFASHVYSFVKNPSKPQVKTFELVKSIFGEAVLNFPIYEVNRIIDIAIPSLRIAIEYDGSYWHKDENLDIIRQREVENLGWKFIRYRDHIPSLEELKYDIDKITNIS